MSFSLFLDKTESVGLMIPDLSCESRADSASFMRVVHKVPIIFVCRSHTLIN